ncbi:MAG TPA: polysaccharide biosynthesis/export family protein [Vicinamibacterales bacterium]|jgi:polysaccharide export outer membrane protein|nr:polysaccharide biosynthesis/export family protein [Vicinamibacterales bacterium]
MHSDLSRCWCKPAWTGIAIVFLALLIARASIAAGAQSAADYVIGSQDILLIQVFDQADLGGKYTVEADGTFGFPLIGRVKAGGLTLRAFEGELKARLADGYFRNPQVSIAVEQYRSQRVFVMGEVRQPGPVALTGGMTLIEALARAGSTLSTASGEVAVVRSPQGRPIGEPVLPDQDAATEVFRATIRELESGALSQNLELKDGDTIFVPRAETVYVFGQVKNPGAYSVQKKTTVLQALSLAGGVNEHGAMNRIQIMRIENGTKKEVKVQLTDLVRPEDTIIVPQRYF